VKEMLGDLRGVGLVELSELYKMTELLLARHVLPEMQSCLVVSKLGEQVVDDNCLEDRLTDSMVSALHIHIGTPWKITRRWLRQKLRRKLWDLKNTKSTEQYAEWCDKTMRLYNSQEDTTSALDSLVSYC